MSFFNGYLAQGTGNASAFVENTTGTSRIPVTLTSLSSGQVSLQNAAAFQNSTTVTVTQRALFDAPSGGNLIMWWIVGQPVTASAASPDVLAAGGLAHYFSVLATNGPGAGATPAEFAAGQQIGVTAFSKPIYAGVALEASYGTIYAAASQGASLVPPGSSNVNAYRAISDANGTLLATDGKVVYTALTAARNFTLGSPSALPNMHFSLKDESGAAATYAISLVGTVDGATNKSVNTAYGNVKFYSNGTAWFTE